MTPIEGWTLTLGFVNLALFCCWYIVLWRQKNISFRFHQIRTQATSYVPYLVILCVIVSLHLIEVHSIDAYTTQMIHTDFTPAIHTFEGDIVHQFSNLWFPPIVLFFVLIYIGVYPFTLWFSPFYFVMSEQKKALQILAYGLLIIYSIALPFYLFFPVTNVYTYFHLQSSLEQAIPGVEHFFYTTTTQNNCFPSLHVAMTLLIAFSTSQTKNMYYKYFTYLCAGLVIFSVMFLAIHWITDIIGGVLLAVGAYYLPRHFMKEGRHGIFTS